MKPIRYGLLGALLGLILMAPVLLLATKAEAQYQPSMAESIRQGTADVTRALRDATRVNNELARSNRRLADAVRELNRSMRRR